MNPRLLLTLAACATVLSACRVTTPTSGPTHHPQATPQATPQARPYTLRPTPGFSAPIVIRKGGVYRGKWESLDPDVPAVTIQTREPVVIENATIRGRGHLILGWSVNLTVRNTRGSGLNPDRHGAHAGRFIQVEEIQNLRVENNLLEGTSGIYVRAFQGNPGAGQTIKIVRNKARNIDGRQSDGRGGYTGGFYRVQFVQLNAVRGVPNVEIAWNEVINEPNKSHVEDNISLYQSSGTPSSPIRIHNNFIQGAYPLAPDRNGEYSGGGILIGDGPQHSPQVAGGYAHVHHNHVVGTTNYGVAISGGHNQHVYQNRVVSSGRLPDGRLIAAQNVGAYVHHGDRGSPATFFGNTLRDNIISWVRHRADGTQFTNDTWTPSCTADYKTICQNNQPFPGRVSAQTEREEHQLWLRKVASARLKIGPR